MFKPFLKWPGGKSDEIAIIHNYLPDQINNYIEPFLGGGACFLSLESDQYNEAFVNDLSDELMDVYKYIAENNTDFYNSLLDIWNYWNYAGGFTENYFPLIIELYLLYKQNLLNDEEIKTHINNFFTARSEEIINNLPDGLNLQENELLKIFKSSLLTKFKNMKKKELRDGDLPTEDYKDNVEAGIRTGVYTYYRYIYNNPREILDVSRELHVAIFFYLREFCYSSMFRYNDSGGFNVPYGGLSYNNKNFVSKIEYTQSESLRHILLNAEFSNLDFQSFLESITITNADFMFLDPPYDGGFSTYANNPFEQEDQRRLADYLINNCNCRFMLIIKNTEFIASLYEGYENIKIMGFDKDYKVSFMDRNDKKVLHLLIKNY